MINFKLLINLLNVWPKVFNNLKIFIYGILRHMEINFLNLILLLKKETGIGKTKTLHTHLLELRNNLIILDLIVWMLFLWLCILFGTQNHSSNAF